MSKILLLVVFTIGLQTTFGQSSRVCSISPESQELIMQRMLSNRATFMNSLQARTGGSIYVPVRFWLTANSDSSGRFTDYIKLFNFFCGTNNCIGDQSIVFYLKEIDETINNTNIHSYTNNEGSKLIKDIVSAKYDAINVFICKDVNDIDYGHYHLEGDFITLNTPAFQDSTALCHLIGHFLSLQHTSGDWIAYDCKRPTLEQRIGQRLPEYESRTKTDSNGIIICQYAGDGFCDTDADYAEIWTWPDPCIYSGCAKDPDNVNLHPNIKNPMSNGAYIRSINCFDTFSNQQKEAMIFDYLSPKRDYLKGIYSPLGHTNNPIYLKPSNQFKFTNYDSIFFDWKDDPNTPEYILEISEDISFKYNVQRFRTKVSQYLLTNLAPRKIYFWRVLAYNSNSFCNINPLVATFTTGVLHTSLSDPIENKIKYKIVNSSSGDKIVIQFENAASLQLNFILLDLNGHKIMNEMVVNNEIRINKQNLNSGLYFMNLSQLNKIVFTKKLLIF